MNMIGGTCDLGEQRSCTIGNSCDGSWSVTRSLPFLLRNQTLTFFLSYLSLVSKCETAASKRGLVQAA